MLEESDKTTCIVNAECHQGLVDWMWVEYVGQQTADKGFRSLPELMPNLQALTTLYLPKVSDSQQMYKIDFVPPPVQLQQIAFLYPQDVTSSC
jgi:hypothetical protein